MRGYKDVKSNQQIGAVRKCNQAGDYYRLATLIADFVRKQKYNGYLATTDKFLFQYKGDHNLYCRIRDLNPPKTKKEYAPIGTDRSYVGQSYAGFIKKAIDTETTLDSYLDFGCGTGAKTLSVGTQLGIPEEAIHGVDVRDWSVLDEETPRAIKNVKFITPGDPLPYEDEQFALISAFSVLHHVRNMDEIATEIARCLRPGGYLVIREHHAEDHVDQMIVEIQHRLFDYVKIPDFGKESPPDYINCRSHKGWCDVFGEVGLTCITHGPDLYNKSAQDPTKLYHAIFRRG